MFQITEPDGNVRTIEGTAEAFHADPELAGMKIDVNQFLNGAITKAISVPGTYTELGVSAHGCCRRLHLDGQWHYQRR